MNKRIKRLSKPVLAFALTLTLLMSCLTAGMAVTSAEDAAAPLAEQKADAAPQPVNTVTQPAPAPQTAPVPAAPASVEKADAPVAAPAAEQTVQANTPAQDSAPAQEPVVAADVQQDTAQAEQPAVPSKDDDAPVGASDDSEEVGYTKYNDNNPDYDPYDDPAFEAAKDAGKAFRINFDLVNKNDLGVEIDLYGLDVYGSFDDSDIGTYVKATGNDDMPYDFINDEVKAQFLSKFQPYIDVTGKKIRWDYYAAQRDRLNGGGLDVLVFGEVENSSLQLYFDLPYEHNGVKPIENNGKVNKDDIDRFLVTSPVYLGDSYEAKAPEVIYDGDTPLYFNYWSVTKMASANNKHEAMEYTRCYDKNFNLSIYTNSVVTPVYKSSRPTGIDDQGITIAHINNSRGEENVNMEFLVSYNNVLGGVQLNKLDWFYCDGYWYSVDTGLFEYAYDNNGQLPAIVDYAGVVCDPYLYIEAVDGSDIETDGETKTEADYRSLYGDSFGHLDEVDLLNIDDIDENKEICYACRLSLNNKNRVSIVRGAKAAFDPGQSGYNFANLELINANLVYRAGAVLYQVKIGNLPTADQLENLKQFILNEYCEGNETDYQYWYGDYEGKQLYAMFMRNIVNGLISGYTNTETLSNYGINMTYTATKTVSAPTYFTIYDIANTDPSAVPGGGIES